MVLDAVMSDHANCERSFNRWLHEQKKEKFENTYWFQELSNEEKVNHVFLHYHELAYIIIYLEFEMQLIH